MWILGESTPNQVSCDSLWQWAKHEFMYIPPLLECVNSLNAKSISRLKPRGQRTRMKKSNTTNLIILLQSLKFWCYLIKCGLYLLKEWIGQQPCKVSIWFTSHAAGFSLQWFHCPCKSAEGGTNIWWNCQH